MPLTLSNTGGTGKFNLKNNNNNGNFKLSSTNLLLDTYPGASMALSLRKLKKTYTGSAIRVQRSSDNTQQDIGFSGNFLDTASLETFVGVGTGTVVTWYDQSGNGYNVTKFSTTGTPDIIVNGTTQILNNKTAVYFDGSKTLVSAVAANLLSNNKTAIFFGVGSADDTDTRLMLMIGGQAANSQALRRNGNVLEAIGYNSNQNSIFTDEGSVNVGTSQFIACTERNTATIEIFTNTQSNGSTSGTGTPDGTNSQAVLGSFDPIPPSFGWYGYIQEIIVFALDPSSNTTYKTNVAAALNSYYTTY